jgi:PAS domain S-box-containing protein
VSAGTPGAASSRDPAAAGPAPSRRLAPLAAPAPQRGALGVLAVSAGLVGCFMAWENRLPLAALATLALAALSLLGMRARPEWLRGWLAAMLVGACTLLVGIPVLRGWGLAAPSHALLPVAVFTLTAACGWRAGAALALALAAALAGVHAIGVTPELPDQPHPLFRLAAAWLAPALGLGAGTLAAQGIARLLDEASEREGRWRSLLALAADAYWEIDAAYRLTTAVSHRHELPLTRAGGIGALPWELSRFACDPEVLDQIQADLAGRVPLKDVPIRWQLADGTVLHLLVSGQPRFDAEGLFTGYWGVARDITADSAAQAALVATETRYQELFTRIPTPLVLHRAGRVFDANPAALRLLGHEELSSLLGTNLLALYESGDSRERSQRRLEGLEREGTGVALPVADFKLVAGGRRLSVRATAVRVQMPDGLATLSIFLDDTERRIAEDAVRRSEAMLSHLVATSPDLITLTDAASGRYVMVNDAFERVTGWTAAEAVGRTSLELKVWPDDQSRLVFAQRVMKDGRVTDLVQSFRSKDGSELRLMVSAARFVMDRREYIVINARDISGAERQRLEREAILANASVGIAVTRERRFVLANQRFEALYGWGAGELLGQCGQVVWTSHDDYAALGAEIGPALARGEAVTLERQARRRDGSSFLARIHGRVIDPARPAGGGTVWIVEDVTERRAAEAALARARDDAEAASRAKSSFLANTSHELRTPLNGIVGLAQLARDAALPEDRRRQYLDQIADSAQSLAGIISDILDLSKIEAGRLHVESTAFDLGALLLSLQRTYIVLADAHGLALRLDLGAGSAQGITPLGHAVQGDPLRLRQIVTNFLTNAIKFTPERGGTGEVVLAARRVGGAGGERVRIEVRDNGGGIEPEVLARLFKPFTQADQSTTRRFGGTGLGLSICRELAVLMGGEVGAESTLGCGSVFWAELPLPHVSAPPVPAPAVAEAELAGRRVLMAEDNPVNMLIAVAMLERWGVEVVQATDGRQAVNAVALAAGEGRPFDAVLMDVQMPEMSGHEATRALRATRDGARLPIVALTAAALVSERDAAFEAGMNDFLTKPIDAERLRATLARWLARQPA